jgi:hypothetical protein
MNRKWKVLAGAALTTFLLGALPALGQQKVERGTVEQQRVFTTAGPVQGGPPPGDTFVFVSSEVGFEGQLVKGSPYSAQAVTESTQTLGDGNRIVNKQSTSIYRDSEGRTRREMTLRGFGLFNAGSDAAPQTVFISDPVAGVSYTLDPRSHVARKMPALRFEFKTSGAGTAVSADVHGNMTWARAERVGPVGPPPAGEGPVAIAGTAGSADVFTLRAPAVVAGQDEFVFKREGGSPGNTVTEKLGTQVIEGVAAEGTRTTVTIPAGEIGNERPINIVSERWYSPELKTVVMTRHSDPRTGETVFRLTNISREEPQRSLFEVPADYSVREDSGPMMRTKRLPPPPPQ